MHLHVASCSTNTHLGMNKLDQDKKDQDQY